ncbi:MAG: SGNH/GDSL hydrolase family protein [Verrucomicrobiia bacterium]|jgi:acyl-CoA thioesterase-1
MKQSPIKNIVRQLTRLGVFAVALATAQTTFAAEPAPSKWTYSSGLMRPFWNGDTMTGESVLFVKDANGKQARASTLFPIEGLLAIHNSTGELTYEEGRDYRWKPGAREIVLPAGSRIVSRAPAQLRVPHDSQKYKLTHRDGKSEIMFGAKLEYHALQASITYTHKPGLWKTPTSQFDEKALPNVIGKLRRKEPLRILVMGDSISTGCNASGWADGPPFQPAYPELLRHHLEIQYGGKVDLKNISIDGKNARTGVGQCEQVVAAKPDLVIVAFGMNDSAGRPTDDFRKDIAAIIAKVRADLPDSEFILVATMLGNRDWPRLNQERFPQFRDALTSLCGQGVALADLTAVWTEFLKHKKFSDLTGNGVNHPNDFGHRVYAQVIAALLTPPGAPR